MPTLDVLVPDTEFYDTLAVQPAGEIEAREDRVGAADHSRAVEQFEAYLCLAGASSANLVLAPEYSCPWDVVERAVANHRLPAPGKLWILGCEAITPESLEAIKARWSDVEWIHEPVRRQEGFLDPLAYVFVAETKAGQAKAVIALQFKTEPMADAFERNHLIRGRTVYWLANPRENIRLLSIICSDGLSFDPATAAECRFDLHPYLVFHPQLNRDPRHADIGKYRRWLFTQNNSSRLDVITLNWARGFAFTGDGKGPSSYGGSTIYTKTECGFRRCRSVSSAEVDHPFRSKAITRFGRCRSVISVEGDQAFRRKSITV